MTTAENPKTYDECYNEISAMVGKGAGKWASQKDVNTGEKIAPKDLEFSPGFLEKHFETIK